MPRKKKYKGIVIEDFKIKGAKYVVSDSRFNTYETTNKERFDSLIKLNKIKK